MTGTILLVILVAAGLLLLTSVWHGWSSGLPRMALELVGFILASVCAWSFYPVVASWIPGSIPRPILFPLAGVLIGVTVIVAIKIAGMLLVKKTKHYPNPLRLIFGAGGGAIGLLEALFILCCCALGLRIAGKVAETQLEATGKGEPQRPKQFIVEIVELKKAIDRSWVGPVFEKLDPVPPSYYSNFRKINILSKDRDAMTRFLAFPATTELLSKPEFKRVVEDPEVAENVASRKFRNLLANKNVIATLNDPKTWEALKKFPWGEALNYAVPDKTPAAPQA